MQGLGPYSSSIKKVEKEIKGLAKKVNDLCGIYASLFLFFIKQIIEVIGHNLLKYLFIA
jgi:hypothetical protein